MQIFGYDFFVGGDRKLCPWLDKEYIELMNRTFSNVIKKLGFKQRKALFEKFEVEFVSKNTVLAEENLSSNPTHILVVV